MSDTIANFLIGVKNAALVGKKEVIVPHSKVKENLAKILINEGFLSKAEVDKNGGKKNLKVFLKDKGSRIRKIEINRFSKPGRRVYIQARRIGLIRGKGVVIVSTPQGLLTAKEARKKNLGGELICKVSENVANR